MELEEARQLLLGELQISFFARVHSQSGTL
jgi:hypothetical protein